MQYLRARYYNPASGTFNRLDPFVGNRQDPQSLHKYRYVHGDPIQGVDPTGEFALLVGALMGALVYSNLRKTDAIAKLGVLGEVINGVGGCCRFHGRLQS